MTASPTRARMVDSAWMGWTATLVIVNLASKEQTVRQVGVFSSRNPRFVSRHSYFWHCGPHNSKNQAPLHFSCEKTKLHSHFACFYFARPERMSAEPVSERRPVSGWNQWLHLQLSTWLCWNKLRNKSASFHKILSSNFRSEKKEK